jgi:GH18 family chitinase
MVLSFNNIPDTSAGLHVPPERALQPFSHAMSSHARRPKSRIATSVARVMYTNAVYFPNKRIYKGDTPGMLNYSCINRVYYAFANIGPDGGVFVSDVPKDSSHAWHLELLELTQVGRGSVKRRVG